VLNKTDNKSNVKEMGKSVDFQNTKHAIKHTANSTQSVVSNKSKKVSSIKMDSMRQIIVPLSANELLRKI